MKKLIPILLLFLLLLSACGTDQPEIFLDTLDFEFGDVVNGVIAIKEITLTNLGNADLQIDTIITTCGCTTASVENESLAPGESTILTIEFDSGAHGPELNGELMRQVFITSNDPRNPEITIEFSANVILPED